MAAHSKFGPYVPWKWKGIIGGRRWLWWPQSSLFDWCNLQGVPLHAIKASTEIDLHWSLEMSTCQRRSECSFQSRDSVLKHKVEHMEKESRHRPMASHIHTHARMLLNTHTCVHTHAHLWTYTHTEKHRWKHTRRESSLLVNHIPLLLNLYFF